jgi:hypothetical protein
MLSFQKCGVAGSDVELPVRGKIPAQHYDVHLRKAALGFGNEPKDLSS